MMPLDVLAASSFCQGDQGGKDGENTYSTPNKDWPVLQEFTQGQSMEIKAVMKAWHYVRTSGLLFHMRYCVFHIRFMWKRENLRKRHK